MIHEGGGEGGKNMGREKEQLTKNDFYLDAASH
jgi:hypothetical protein